MAERKAPLDFRCILASMLAGMILLAFFNADMAVGSRPAQLRDGDWPPRNGIHILQVSEGPLIVRDAPDGESLFSYAEGATFVVDFSRPPVVDQGLMWAQHERGWTAIGSEDRSQTFVTLVNASSAKTLKPSQQDPDAPADLPLTNRLFSRLPVSLEETEWVQYFGNTSFAAQYGKEWNYDGYAQGLHAGLDFGNRSNVVPVHAALDGEIVLRGRDFIHIRAGAYTVVYEHLAQVIPGERGQGVSADTIIGRMGDTRPDNRHIHLEVRYEDADGQVWMVNPLLLLPRRDVREITKRFDALRGNHFYYRLDWAQWITPLDQPIIKYGGPLIGPTA